MVGRKDNNEEVEVAAKALQVHQSKTRHWVAGMMSDGASGFLTLKEFGYVKILAQKRWEFVVFNKIGHKKFKFLFFGQDFDMSKFFVCQSIHKH